MGAPTKELAAMGVMIIQHMYDLTDEETVYQYAFNIQRQLALNIADADAYISLKTLWKTVKYEEIYLKAYESISHARKELTRFFDRYNTRRPHQGLADMTPDEV